MSMALWHHGSLSSLPFFLRLPSLYPETPSKAKWEDMINWWYSAYVYSISSPPPWSTLFPSSSLWCKPQFWPIGLLFHPSSFHRIKRQLCYSFALNIITSEEKCTHLFQALFKKNEGAWEPQKGLFSKHLLNSSYCFLILNIEKHGTVAKNCYFKTLFIFSSFFCWNQKIRLMMSWAKKWMYNLTQNGHLKRV